METPAKSLPKTKRGQFRRDQILAAAEEVFSELGFAHTSVADITRRAGTAQGTLYIYFNSKEEVFREVMLQLGSQIRREIAAAIEAEDSRINAEVRGLETYLNFVARRPSVYRIVQQCAIVDRVAWREFYQTVFDRYSRNLRAAEADGDLRPGDPELRAWMFIGIFTILGERVADWGNAPDIGRMVREYDALLRHGIAPEL